MSKIKAGFYCFEGNIGVGKTTLVNELAKKLTEEGKKVHILIEPLEENNPYLELYYENPKKYAFMMQIFLITARYRQHEEAQALARNGWICLSDRSFYCDIAFVLTQENMEFMTKNEVDLYLSISNDYQRFALFPNKIIYINQTPEAAYKWMKKRARKCENEVPLTYLKNLDTNIKRVIKDLEKRTDVHILEDEDGTVNIEERVQKAIKLMELPQSSSLKYHHV